LDEKTVLTFRHVVKNIACGVWFGIVKPFDMKILAAVFRGGTKFKSFICVSCILGSPPVARAVDWYRLDFTAPDLGSYQVTAGSPVIQATAGVFSDALVFDAVTGGEQIRLPIGSAAPRYELQFDLLTHNLLNSDYSFGVYFDTAVVRSVNLHGGLNGIYLYQSAPFLNLSLAALANESVYHFAIALDAVASEWSVALNGNPRFSGACDAAALEGIRFGISPLKG
jgi:hypothetical protein